MIVPIIDEVIRLNKLLITRYGGEFVETDNFLNRSSLEWALEAIQAQQFGHDPYPSLAHKAAVLAWTIITGHVFIDGNKRTGMALAYLLIRLNGRDFRVSEDETVQTALDIAQYHDSGLDLAALTGWFAQHIV